MITFFIVVITIIDIIVEILYRAIRADGISVNSTLPPSYLWTPKVPIKVSAPKYFDYLLTWVEKQLSDDSFLPAASRHVQPYLFLGIPRSRKVVTYRFLFVPRRAGFLGIRLLAAPPTFLGKGLATAGPLESESNGSKSEISSPARTCDFLCAVKGDWKFEPQILDLLSRWFSPNWL